MENRRDPRQRRLSRRSLIRRTSALAAVPILGGCTLLDALEDDRHTVTISEVARFEPAGMTIPVGGTVVWRNMDTARHTVTTDPSLLGDPNRVQLPEGAEPWDSGDLSPGEQWSHTFTTPGIYVYACRHHQSEGMVGTVTVEEDA